MSKVALFLPSGSLGGAEQVLVQLANASKVEGDEVWVFTLTNVNIKQLKEGLLSEINLISFAATRELVGILKLLFHLVVKRGKYSFDYAFTSHVHLNAYISLLRKLSVIKVDKHIARESTSIFLRFKGKTLKYYNFLYDLSYKYIDLIICQSDLMRNDLIRNKPKLLAKKVITLANPITPLSLSVSLQDPFVGRDYMVSAGRLIPEKGFDLLISAFHKLSDLYPKLELIILGEGVLRNSLQEQIERLDLSERVKLVGWSSDVYSYFCYAKVCVVSSRIEGFPNVLLQMMMVNNRVVSTLCAGTIDLIPGIHLSATNDDEALSAAILNALKMDQGDTRSLFDKYLADRDVSNYLYTVKKLLT